MSDAPFEGGRQDLAGDESAIQRLDQLSGVDGELPGGVSAAAPYSGGPPVSRRSTAAGAGVEDTAAAPAAASGLGTQPETGAAPQPAEVAESEVSEPGPADAAPAPGLGTQPETGAAPQPVESAEPELSEPEASQPEAAGPKAAAGADAGEAASPPAREPDVAPRVAEVQEEGAGEHGGTPDGPVSRETTTTTDEQRETMPNVDGLPDTATQGAEQARFGPTLAPTSSPMTAAEIAADSGTASTDPTTPLASATHEDLRGDRHRDRTLPRPDETRVLVIANQKGGVGKTTTTVNMAAGLAQHGLRALIIDLDPQGNASTALGIDHSAGTLGVYEVMADGTPMKEVIKECPDVPNLYGVPATIDLAGAEIELVSLVARESRLRKALDAYLTSLQDSDERFDYVFIDCPPSLGLLTINALVAGREMLIPIQCEYYALEGVTQLLRNVDMVRAHLNPELQVSTIVLTMYDGRTRLAAGVADEVRQHFGDLVLKTAIPRSVRISEAPSYGQTVLTYDPTSTGALSYLEAARELATHPTQQTEEQ